MSSNKKIWGVYSTLNKQELDVLTELEIWNKIYSLSRDINFTLKYLERPGNKDVNIKALIDEQFNLEYLIYYTRKFGVSFDMEPNFGKHIEKSNSFNEWYLFWENYFISMDANTYQNFLKDKRQGNDISSYMPNNKWNDNIENTNDNFQLQIAYQ